MNVSKKNIYTLQNLAHLSNLNEAELGEHKMNQKKCADNQCTDFGLNRLFDMDKIVKNVKNKLRNDKEDKDIPRNNCVKQEGVRSQEQRNSDQWSLKDNKSDSDSSFGLKTLFAQKKNDHKRQRRKGKKIVKQIKKDGSYGLEWLFSEKHDNDKRCKHNKRKRRKMDYDKSESEDDYRDEVIKEKRKRPNHFVAIRVLDSKIHLATKEFQKIVLKENEKLKPALIPLISLHITMAVMHLDDSMLEIAKDSLEICKDKITEALADVDFRLTFHGVGNFKNQVVFAKIQEKEQIKCIKTINSMITEVFEKNGICLSDKKEYNPHLTLMKLSRKSSLRKNGIRKVEEKSYAPLIDLYFGDEIVKNVYLCSMHGDKEDDGFYKCLSSITFSN